MEKIICAFERENNFLYIYYHMSPNPESVSAPDESNNILSSGATQLSHNTMYKYWCATVFYEDECEKIDWIVWIKHMPKWIIGYEVCPKTGKKHMQCFFEHYGKRGAKARTIWNRWPRIHIKPAYASIEANLRYCSKDGNYETNLKFDQELNLLSPSMFYDWQRNLVEMVLDKPDDRQIYWYYELEGCAGKTAIAKYICAKLDAIVVSGKSSDCKNAIMQFKASKSYYPTIIIFDIPRCNNNHLSYEAMECIKNGFFYSGKYEGGMCIFNSPHVIVFSNQLPEMDKLSHDRWQIIHIDDNSTIN